MVSRPRFDDVSPTEPAAGPGPEPAEPREGLSARAEIQFLAIAVAGALLLLLSGLPGGREPLAGDGSDALRLKWAARLERLAPVPTEGVGPDGTERPGDRPASTAPR